MTKIEKNIFQAMFISGVALSFFHPLFALLTIAIFAWLSYIVFNWLSFILFKKQFEVPSKVIPNQKLAWTDWVLLLPFVIFWVLPLFAVGEASNCFTGIHIWENYYGFCE